MQFKLISLRQAAATLDTPFQLRQVASVGEYRCALYRCEGTMPLHRHLDHDELFWPQDGPIHLLGEAGGIEVEAGSLARVPRGWKHASAAPTAAYVLLVSRGERSFSLNGYHSHSAIQPPQVASPDTALEGVPNNVAHPLLHCDSLRLYAERVVGTGPPRRAARDVLLVPTRGSVGLRCGGIVVVVQETEIARLPAGCGWHLFGGATVVWMTPE